MLGVGIPFPVLNETVVANCAVSDKKIVAPWGTPIPRRVRPTFGLVSYAQLKTGRILIEGKPVRAAPLASMFLSRQVALELKQQIEAGQFTLTAQLLPYPPTEYFSRKICGAPKSGSNKRF